MTRPRLLQRLPSDTRTIDLTVADGVQVRAFLTGAPSSSDTVPVLLHGIGMTHRTFTPVQRLLAEWRPVVSLDLPGFGSTPKPPRPFAVADHAAAVDAALDQLGIGRRVLVGHSMGAQFAVESALRAAAPVAGVVLIGPVVDPRRPTLGGQALVLAADTLREPPSVNAVVFTDYLRCGLRWYLRSLQAMFDYDTEQQVRRLTEPVLVLRGGRDPIVGAEWCRRLTAAAPAGSELVTIPGLAHVIPRTAAPQIADAISSLVERQADRA